MSSSPKTYARMSLAEKQAEALDRQREPSVTCPRCETETTAADLMRHVENTCPGAREPHPRSRWITWREALSLGVPKPTMGRWIQQGLVRFHGESKSRVYLLRDVVQLAATRQRRKSRFRDQKRRAR